MSEIHVYAKARVFMVVPVCGESDCQPAQTVELIVGRDSVGMLVDALQDALAIDCETADAWDGDAGKWWTYHLLKATLTVDGDMILAEDEDGTRADFAAIKPRAVAEWLIKQVGARLV